MQQLLRLPTVLERTGMKRSSLYAAVADGQFPRPIKLNDSGRAVAWPAVVIDAWIESRVTATRDGKGVQHEPQK